MSQLLNLLIVDDSAEMRRAIKQVVQNLVSEIHECADGAEALTAYAAHRPDWVLMDTRMKKTDGFVATRKIKAVFPEARIIIVTICTGKDMKEAAQAAGACGYVVKDNLLELRQLLIERSVEQQSQPTASC